MINSSWEVDRALQDFEELAHSILRDQEKLARMSRNLKEARNKFSSSQYERYFKILARYLKGPKEQA